MHKKTVIVTLLAAASFALGSFIVPHLSPEIGQEEGVLLAAMYVPTPERVERHLLERGETLGAVLSRAELVERDVASVLLALREFLDPRRLRPGAEVIVRRRELDGTPRAVELQVNADTTVRLEREPLGWNGSVVLAPTTVDTTFAAGVIEQGRTLYGALVDNAELDLPREERIQLVAELADIYGYKLDFSREIRAGDSFRFVFEREAREDGTGRSRRILVAEVHNQGTSFPAIHFTPPREDQGGYYDPDGKSLRLAFRRYPVDYVRITSSFSWQRYHPVLGVNRPHLGTDFGAPSGTPVRSTSDGVIASAGVNGGYGNLVVVRHPGGYTTHYAHLSRFASGIRPGTRVSEGQVIGYVGQSGLATGPHLHYELRRDGTALNARTAKLPGSPPVPEELIDTFLEVADERLELFERFGLGPHLATAPEAVEE